MKNISKPENLVLVKKLELADYLEWLLPQSELYNTVLAKSLNQFWSGNLDNKEVNLFKPTFIL